MIVRRSLSRAALGLSLFGGLISSIEAGDIEKNDDGFKTIESLTKDSFKLQVRLKVTLDGSEAASLLHRTGYIKDDLVFLDRDQWRLFRQNPFNAVAYEWLQTDKGLFLISSQNNRNSSPTSMPEGLVIHSVATPLHLAQAWGLMDSRSTLEELLSKLTEGPLTKDEHSLTLQIDEPPASPPDNAQANKLPTPDSQRWLIQIKGSLLHDNKTKVNLEGTWELKKMKIVPQDLNELLMRSS